jgi:hypothetical protein
MIYSIYAQKDSTIYESSQSLNTGLDEILEIQKTVTAYSASHNSRILIKFNLSEISSSIVQGTVAPDARFYLNLRCITADEIPLEYTLEARPVSQSWEMGVGRKHSRPSTSAGVSWRYRTGNIRWLSSSFVASTTGSYITNAGGGVWYTGSINQATQSFNFESADVRMDVTNIVRSWLSGSINNEGLIIKRIDSEEQNNTSYGRIKFFSTDTHTIYPPRLEVCWDDAVYTGSLSALTDENIILYVKGLKSEYKDNAKAIIRVSGRPAYPVRSFATSSAYLDIKSLPSSSYYSIMDSVTDEVIVPFDENYTKLSCDSNGNYLSLWTKGLQLERYYKFVFKVRRNGIEDIFDNGYYFKVVR